MNNFNNTDLAKRLESILETEAEAVRKIPLSDAYAKAVDLIVEQVHRKGGKLVTSGMGKAGQIAMNIATTFCSTGTPSVFLHPSEAQHGDLLSNSGKTREILELLDLAQALYPGIPFIVLTGDPSSPLAAATDIALFTGASPEVCPLGMTPTTSTTMMTVIGDLLVVATMEAIGFTVEEYALRHHGGYLGHKSKEASYKVKH